MKNILVKMTKYSLICSFCLFILYVRAGYDKLPQLLDSLSVETNPTNFVKLAVNIANELKFQDNTRAVHYIELAEKKAIETISTDIWKFYYYEAYKFYSDIDALDLAFKNILKLYNYYKDSNEFERYDIENQIGVLYAKMKNYQKALFYFKHFTIL